MAKQAAPVAERAAPPETAEAALERVSSAVAQAVDGQDINTAVRALEIVLMACIGQITSGLGDEGDAALRVAEASDFGAELFDTFVANHVKRTIAAPKLILPN